MSGIDWKWIVGLAITLGMTAVGAMWALVHLVAKLVAEATEIKSDLRHLGPRVTKAEERIEQHEDEDAREHREMESRVTQIDTRTSALSSEVSSIREDRHDLVERVSGVDAWVQMQKRREDRGSGGGGG